MLRRIIKYSMESVEIGWFLSHFPSVDHPSITVTAELLTWDLERRQPHWETSEVRKLLEDVMTHR
jgi:hypothetical protein